MPQPSVARGFVVAIWFVGVPAVFCRRQACLDDKPRNVTGSHLWSQPPSCSCGGERIRHTACGRTMSPSCWRHRIDGKPCSPENVRNFEWRSETDYTPLWRAAHTDLDRLRSADLVLPTGWGRTFTPWCRSVSMVYERVVFSLKYARAPRVPSGDRGSLPVSSSKSWLLPMSADIAYAQQCARRRRLPLSVADKPWASVRALLWST